MTVEGRHVRDDTPLRPTRGGFLGWKMVCIASLAQNVGLGVTFGSFGVLVLAAEARFHTSRTLSTLGISITILVLSLGALAIPPLLRFVSLRFLMATGSLLGAAGYFLLSAAGSIGFYLAVIAIFISPAVMFIGGICPQLLVSNWFHKDHGRALGYVYLPVLSILSPICMSYIYTHYGFSAVLVSLGLVYLATFPVFLFIVDKPEMAGQLAWGQTPVDPGSTLEIVKPSLSVLRLLKSPLLWLIMLASGMTLSGASLKTSHLIPLLSEMGLTLERASFLQSLGGLAGLGGVLVFGRLADRIGGGRALALNCIIQGAIWGIYLQAVPYPLLMVAAAVSGACSSGFLPAQQVLVRRAFSGETFGRALAMLAVCQLPFTVGAGPVTSVLYDATGSYWTPLAVQICIFVIAAFMFFMASRSSGSSAVSVPTSSSPTV